jgi:cellulose synthase/poly-beta-1,6-N-acetylglucosamine synthase-like glycosyltransferase
VIASDGSTDDTVAIARRYEDSGVRVCAFEKRRGKSAVLNAVVPTLRGEIVLFADARQQFDCDALRAIVSNFADPCVGAVSGELMLRATAGTTAAGYGTAFYWRYEKFVRSMESRADSTICATGAVYAIRREAFEPIPDDTILDDMLIPLRIVRRGYRVLFEPEARAYDSVAPSARYELTRKMRTNAGLFQLFARERLAAQSAAQPSLVRDDVPQGASSRAAAAACNAARRDTCAGRRLVLSARACGAVALLRRGRRRPPAARRAPAGR